MTSAAPTIMVRNTRPGPTVHTFGDQQVTWQGAGDPDGLDVQPVTAELFQQVQFRQSLARGIFVEVDDQSEIDDAIAHHRDEWQQRDERQRDAGREALEFTQDNDILMLTCLGPAGQSGNLCGEPLSIKSSKASETPPLCKSHKSLAGQFVAEEGTTIKNGKPEVKWIRIRQGARTRQQD